MAEDTALKPRLPSRHPLLTSLPLGALGLAIALATGPVQAAETGTTSLSPPTGQNALTPVKNVLRSIGDLFRFEDRPAAAPGQTTPETVAAPQPIDQPQPVRDLPYGDALFEYYQQHYFAAITRILIARQRGQLGGDAEHAQVLLGALYTSYGMLDKGEAIFNQLLASNATPAAADEAWYQLARIHYKSGDFVRARDILTGNIVTPLPKRPTEHSLLLALCHIRLGEADQAKALLPYLKDDDNLSVYARFNLGAAFAQAGELDKASRFYSAVAETDTRDENSLVLKDQATLALGVRHLKQQQWEEARAVLEDIRLYGPVSSRGLLALGWTYFHGPDPADALSPWEALAERDLTDPAVQEALLNIPYVYEQQGALQDALDRYRQAHDTFRQQRDVLEQAKQDIRQPDWIRKISPLSLENTQDVMDAIPPFKLDAEDPASRHLYLYFASNEFQRAYRDYRELQRLYMVLQHWKRQLPSFNQMIATHLQRLEKLGPKSERAAAYSRKFRAYARVKRDEYGQKLDQIIANDDLLGTATVPQQDQKARLDAVEAGLKALGEPALYEEEWRKFNMLKGLLMWDLNATALDRRWEMSKDRIAIDNLLQEMEQRIRGVEQARASRMDRFQGFESRITGLEQRITATQAGIAIALQQQRNHLQTIAAGIVEQHQAQLDRMRGKALLSIARLQDRGYVQERERSSRQYLKPGTAGAAPATGEPAPTPAAPSDPQNLRDAIRQLLDD